ncbi:tannase-domain-containing protein [Dothidotthia symphoricarpi CBS 119687]|uniref:Carboxylic ester hydrolase n=1 Tax=Dothidotthia symphoricarpi CBS 119687 TaxID=1392245 RepID=A0A6A6A0C9_9PLEO|nr:tannase-domain-containing protein [Dothidotthia symphoricarpi CBS 119687]KAF2124041.1 tannase-domain-containing protein [Dothidotthia symphoricarpi CBS 119687]
MAKRLLHLLPFVHATPAYATPGQNEESDVASPRCDSSAFSKPDLGSHIEILSFSAVHQSNYTSVRGSPILPALNELSFCQVQVYLTHKGTNDKVLVEVWLPSTHDNWNGRFQATGGAGFATGMFSAQLGVAVQNGWAAVSTDGGHDPDLAKTGDASWALNEDRSIDWNLFNNFATRSVVEQIAVGKNITEQYFGKKPHHSYWNGCSTGGRQGYAIAQRYPHLVDGILANAPAISFAHFVTGEFHPQITMKLLDTYMSKCELEYFRWQAIERCDMLDGVRDGMLEDPEACDFDPNGLVGDTIECDGAEVQITKSMAQLVIEIQKGFPASGPRVWQGLAPGVPMDALAGISVSSEGVRSQRPFPISSSWLKNFLLRDESFNLSSLEMPQFVELFAQASYEYGAILNADNPDLSALQMSDTKLLTWHGLNDQLIPFQNTVAYRKRVEGAMGGAQAVDDYYRLFLVPGVQHCGGGDGPVPTDPLAALITWVEDGQPPETLDAETTTEYGETITRELCAWPAKSKYMGIGDAKRASSWSCEGGTERLEDLDLDKRDEQVQFLGMQMQPQKPGYRLRKDDDNNDNVEDGGRTGQVLAGLKDRLEGLDLGLMIG